MTKIAKMGLISQNISIELLCLKRCNMAGHLEKEIGMKEAQMIFLHVYQII